MSSLLPLLSWLSTAALADAPWSALAEREQGQWGARCHWTRARGLQCQKKYGRRPPHHLQWWISECARLIRQGRKEGELQLARGRALSNGQKVSDRRITWLVCDTAVLDILAA